MHIRTGFSYYVIRIDTGNFNVICVRRVFMDDIRGFLGGIIGNPTVLFFIIVFLLLFWGCTGPACVGFGDPK